MILYMQIASLSMQIACEICKSRLIKYADMQIMTQYLINIHECVQSHLHITLSLNLIFSL